ncbi:hypothetical protein PALB_31150 [Pseudoalteromonas luteoviolacea B = ATCC 29581]|nr:hypothetical protein PALB_31150 [Pseudoalteromonas luteoviolacea B = ATCC 29581]
MPDTTVSQVQGFLHGLVAMRYWHLNLSKSQFTLIVATSKQVK